MKNLSYYMHFRYILSRPMLKISLPSCMWCMCVHVAARNKEIGFICSHEHKKYGYIYV